MKDHEEEELSDPFTCRAAEQKFASTPGITSDGRAKRDRAINALKNAIETMAPEAVLAVFKQPTQVREAVVLTS